ncbi:MAG: hypothetical protein KAS84_04080 [Anaerolineales bacterium]|nr:hypothetical protein [Anaerolineales bacterium]
MSVNKRFGMLIVILLLLTACGSNSAVVDEIESSVDSAQVEEDKSGTGTEAESLDLTTDYAEGALPLATQLVVGSLLLEETNLAVDAELAPSLIPYWKLYKSLAESDTSAPEELDALINEIQEIMTVDQVNYIAGLQLTQEDMMTLINDLGIFEQTRPDDGDGGTGFNRPEGLPEGTRPGGGQGGPGGGDVNIDPELLATMQAEREASGGGRQSSRMTIPLVDELISLLEEKAGS